MKHACFWGGFDRILLVDKILVETSDPHNLAGELGSLFHHERNERYANGQAAFGFVSEQTRSPLNKGYVQK